MGELDTYIIGATAKPEVRAVYFCHDGKPTGFPIMFLRDMGMETAAEELVSAANKYLAGNKL
jgi:hypothetical protein